MATCDFESDFFMLYLSKKGDLMEEIKPLKDFLLMFMTPGFVVGVVLLWIKIKHTERNEEAKEKIKAQEKKENFTNNSFLEIKELFNKSNNKINEIKIEQGKMMKKEDARDEFVDNKRFDLQTESFNKRFDTIEETAKENKNDLKKTAEENKNDLKDFITQSLLLVKKDK